MAADSDGAPKSVNTRKIEQNHESGQSSPHDVIDAEVNPFKWPASKKWTVTLVACYATLIVGINSTSITASATPINNSFHVSDENFPNSYWPVTSWNTGAALAPMIVLPLMENYGMRMGYRVTYVLFFLFVIPQAVAPNFATLVVTRFIAGCCGGVIQDVMDGIIADVWPGSFQRSLPVTIYVFALLLGVTLGPVVGGAITTSLNWRWIFYVQLIIYGASAPLIFYGFQETRGPVLAAKYARNQQSTSSTPSPPTNSAPLKSIIWHAISRPTHLLLTEPVVLFFTLLSALSYGIVFMSTQSVTQVFIALYSFSEPITGLAQSSIAVGECLGFGACLVQNHIYSRGRPVPGTADPPPETRLYIAIPGCVAGLAGGLFLYGWTSTSTPHPPQPIYPWPVPCVGLALTGFGSVTVMQAIMMYVTDAYALYAASASAAVCFGENIFAAFLPLATMAMYGSLGFAWASSLLGFLALALGVAPAVLLWKGEAVRKRSPFMEAAAYE